MRVRYFDDYVRDIKIEHHNITRRDIHANENAQLLKMCICINVLTTKNELASKEKEREKKNFDRPYFHTVALDVIFTDSIDE